MYTGLLHLHSALRYLVLVLLILAIGKALSGWLGNKPFTNTDKRLATFSVISVHIQLLIGVALYFISPLVQLGSFSAAMKDDIFRFWTVEHIAGMLIAITLITVGNAKSKRTENPIKKHKNIALFFIVALVVIFISIPWPFSNVARAWF